jgi:alpha-L-fucosidase
MEKLKRIVMCLVLSAPAVLTAQTYTATWASVNTHPPAPEWFKDAKFGIYFHWGVYSVPAYGDEWYPRNMYNNGSSAYNHHVATYGDPYTTWPYHNFINGANNRSGVFTQFAPRLKSNGGNFDPVEWADLFDSAGARFAGPVAEHHDGFSNWRSTVNEWNSYDKGPRLDLASLFASAIRAKGMKYMMSMHHAYHFTGFFQWVPAQSDNSLKKLYGQLGATAENQLWYDKLREIIDLHQPDLIWHDFNLTQVTEAQRLNFLAYYYNKGVEWGKEVVVTYKDGFNDNGEVYDYERGGPASIRNPYWLTDDAISSSSWCYTQGIGYYSTAAMLH